jgi:hypothetical protein
MVVSVFFYLLTLAKVAITIITITTGRDMGSIINKNNNKPK